MIRTCLLILAVLSSFWWFIIPLIVFTVKRCRRHGGHLGPFLEKQQQEQRLVIPRGLRGIMDPLLAAQVYNRSHSALCRLPDELIFLIVRQLDGDAVALFCLGRVSRAFRRVIRGPSVWAHMPLPGTSGFAEKMHTTWLMTTKERAQLRRLLDADGMCNACRHTSSWLESKIYDYSNPNVLSGCAFSLWGSAWRIHCFACPCHHAAGAFSRDWDPRSLDNSRRRRCLGREGAVRLCEHVSIRWAAVEQHILAWGRDRRGDADGGGDAEDASDTSNAEDTDNTGDTDDSYDSDPVDGTHDLYHTPSRHDLDVLVAEWHHPMHNTSCGPGQPPTWPRARLQNVDNHNNQDLVLLVMEWAPHSGVGAVKPTLPGGDDRPAAEELRALFHKYRRPGQPAEELMPQYPSGPLPEMACFDPDACQCLRYDVGEDQSDNTRNDEEKRQKRGPDVPETDLPAFPQPPRFFRNSCHPRKRKGFVPIGAARRHGFYSSHSYWRGIDRGGEPGQCVWMRQHWPRGGKDPEEGLKGPRPCLVTTYRRAVVVCDNDSSRWTCWHRPGARLPPTHDWFHAMDPDTYVQPEGMVPLCKERACINYYKRPKTVQCHPAQANLHGDCRH